MRACVCLLYVLTTNSNGPVWLLHVLIPILTD